MQELLRCRAVSELVQLSVPSIYRKMAEGTFPRPIKVGARAVRWRREAIESWLNEQPAGGGAQAAQGHPA